MSRILNIIFEHSREKVIIESDHIVFPQGNMLYITARFTSIADVIKFLRSNDQCVLNIFYPDVRVADTPVYQKLQQEVLKRKPTSSVVVENFMINLTSPFVGLKHAVYNEFPLIINVFINRNQKNGTLAYMQRVSRFVSGQRTMQTLKHLADAYFCKKFFRAMIYSAHVRGCATQRYTAQFRRAHSCSRLEKSLLPVIVQRRVVFDAFRQKLMGKIADSCDQPFSVQIALYLTTKTNIGAYHTGVVLLGCEVAYGGTRADVTGLYFQQPGKNQRFYFQRFIDIGQCVLPFYRAIDVLCSLSDNWRGRDYNIVSHNCNDFSSILCQLLCYRSIPAFINRLAKFGRKFV